MHVMLLRVESVNAHFKTIRARVPVYDRGNIACGLPALELEHRAKTV